VVEISEKIPLIFPVHPRTLGKLEEFGIGVLRDAENMKTWGQACFVVVVWG
jgi:hypothetical protein